MLLQIEEKLIQPGVTLVELKGRLALGRESQRVESLADELVKNGHLKVVMDLSGVDYVDSAGIGVLIGKYLSVRRKGGSLKLLHLSMRAHHALEITHLLTVFETFEHEDAAVKSFSG